MQGKASVFDLPPGDPKNIRKNCPGITLQKSQTIGSKTLATIKKLEFIIQDHWKLPQKMPNLPPKTLKFRAQKNALFAISFYDLPRFV
jgi:hypothetical protein